MQRFKTEYLKAADEFGVMPEDVGGNEHGRFNGYISQSGMRRAWAVRVMRDMSNERTSSTHGLIAWYKDIFIRKAKRYRAEARELGFRLP